MLGSSLLALLRNYIAQTMGASKAARGNFHTMRPLAAKSKTAIHHITQSGTIRDRAPGDLVASHCVADDCVADDRKQRRSRSQERVRTLATLSFGALVSLGCELGNSLGDLATELADPELESVQTGGRQVIAGEYRDVRFDGTSADGAFVVALRDNEHLSITPFNSGSEGCEAGPASSFRSALRRTDDDDRELDARIAYVAREPDDTRALRFTNFACELDELFVPGGELPIAVNFPADPGFVVQDADARIYYANPWRDELTLLAEDAVRIRNRRRAIFSEGAGGVDKMWALAGGELMVWNSQFELEAQVGENLISIAHSASGAGGPMVALVDETGDLFTAFANDLESIERLDSDVCGVSFNTGLNGRELVYYSPCAESNLVVNELDTGVRRDFGPLDRFRIAGATDSGPLLMYLTDQDENSASVGTLWIRWGENAPIQIGDRGHLGLSRVNTDRELQAVVNWSDNGGDLVAGELGEELEQVAENVAYLSSLGLVSEFDGANGKLHRLGEDDFSLELLADNASIQGVQIDSFTSRGLFLSDFDGQAGNLTLLDGENTELISENVRPGQYQFTALLPMVTVLSDLESGQATLKLRHLERDEQIIVSTGVSEVLEVGWPTEGFLYSVPEGERAGVWFARAF